MNDDLTGAAEQTQKIDDRNSRLAHREASDLIKVWSTAEGRRYMGKIIERSGRWKDMPTDRDAFLRERKLGWWQFGEAILKAVEKIAPEKLALMRREQESDKLLREQEIKNTSEEKSI